MSIARYFAKPAKTTTSAPFLTGTTVFSVTGGYPVGQLDVFMNGVRLISGDDYTATNGTSFTLTNAALPGDVVQYTVYPASPLSYLSTGGGTVSGAITVGPAANPLIVSSNTNDGLTVNSTLSPSLIWQRSGVIRGYDAVANTAGDFVPGTAVDDRVFRSANGFVWGSTTTRFASLTSAGVLDLPFGQIKFPATVNISTDGTTLDDYEEGTWTPTFTATTTNPTVTYAATRYGHYTKIGKAVILQGRIGLSATSGGTGSLRISGLPFVPASGAQAQAGSVGYRANWTTQGPNNCYVETGLAQIQLGVFTATSFTATTPANLSATADVVFGVAYMTDA
jgi:hypothetical protein